jgi:hypothetical protein
MVMPTPLYRNGSVTITLGWRMDDPDAERQKIIHSDDDPDGTTLAHLLAFALFEVPHPDKLAVLADMIEELTHMNIFNEEVAPELNRIRERFVEAACALHRAADPGS